VAVGVGVDPGVGVAVDVGVPVGLGVGGGVGEADAALTTVSTKTPLFVLLLSVMFEDTPAKLRKVPVAVGATTIVAVALAPLPSDPRLQVTTLLMSTEQLPADDVAETKFTANGRMSMITEFGAVAGPLLATPIV
jgi:hypothetical protein